MTVTWRDHPQFFRGYLFLLRPRVVFQAPLDNTNTNTYGKFGSTSIWKLLFFDTPTIGDANASTVKPGMTLLAGTTNGGDDLGRARVRYVTTEGYTGRSEKVISVWASPHKMDGELLLGAGTYLTVLDDYRVWFKPPYYTDNADQYFDGDLVSYAYLDTMMPVANAGPGYAQCVDPSTGLITVSFSGADSYATAYDSALGAFGTDVLGLSATASTENGANVAGNAVDNNAGTYWESTAATGWVKGFPTDACTAFRYTVTCDSSATAPKAWTLRSGTSPTILDQQSDQTGWSVGEKRTFAVDRYRGTLFTDFYLYITENNGAGTIRIREFEVLSEDRTNAYTWTVDDGTITVGDATTEDITATFPRGFRWVGLEVIDSNGAGHTNFCHVPIFAASSVFARERTSYASASITGSSEVVGHEDDDAFDGDRTTYWQTDATKAATLEVDLAAAKYIRSYGLVSSANGDPPRDWTFEYQNADSSAWIVLDTQADQDWDAVESTATTHPSTHITGSQELGHSGAVGFGGASFSASTILGSSTNASKAFDGSSTTGWFTANGQTTGWLKVQLASAATITQYAIQGHHDWEYTAPKNWTFEGSNNDADWITLNTQTNQTSWSNDEVRTFPLGTSVEYIYYRLTVSANNGDSEYLTVFELTLANGDIVATTKLMQIFHLPERARIVGATAHLAKVGSCTATLTPKLYTLSGRDPDTLLGTGNTIAASGLGTGANATITFDTAIWKDAGTYALVLETDGSASAYVTWSCDTHQRYIGGGMRAYNGSSWSDAHADAIFSIVTETEQIYSLSTPVEATNYRLNITDSNNATHIELAELNLYEDYDAPIANFEIVNHRATRSGQEMTFRIWEDIDLDSYPDGTLVMYWETESVGGTEGSLSDAGPSGRTHMKFIGWIDQEPTHIETNDYGTSGYVDLQCVDVGGRLQRLPAFPLVFERDAAPAQIFQMANANIDRFVAALVLYFSTAAEVADFIWACRLDHWAFSILSSEGGTLFSAIDNRAQTIEYVLTCDKLGRLWLKPDPLLAVSGDRTSTVIVDIDETDWTTLDYTVTRPPRVYQLWSSALLVSRTEADALGSLTAYFAVAPGFAPGQGIQSTEKSEMLCQSLDAFDRREGYRYAARLNAPYLYFRVQLAHSADTGIDPAKMEWIRATISADAAAPRGLTLTDARFLPVELTYTYDHTAGTKTVTVVMEKETTGTYAVSYTP